MNCIKNGWTFPYRCLYVALFGSRLSYRMHSWLCDVCAISYRGFMSITFYSTINMLRS